MFCIAAFIIFAILALFSAKYRPLAAKAWHCVGRRLTLRPCDISFSEEMKGKLVGKYVITHPRFARFLNRWINWVSFAFVILSIWSLWYVFVSGLNYWVYDTCSPSNVESCSLSGEACGIDQSKLGLSVAIEEDRLGEWAAGPFTRFAETVSRIPDRLKTWDAKEYLGPTATFHTAEDTAKPYALEIIDPSCKFCKQLTHNMQDAGIVDRQNVSYLLYPIPKGGTGGYKFPHSLLMASYIEATKQFAPLNGTDQSPDWQLIEKMFALSESDASIQEKFVLSFTRAQAEKELQKLLHEIGYSERQVREIAKKAASEEVQQSLAEQARIVEEEVRTIKIPTLLIGGRRYDRAVDRETLEKF